MKPIAALLIATALWGCAGDPARVVVAPETSTMTVRTTARSVEIKEVSLPAYAKEDKIALQNADGSVTSLEDSIWADEPERAMTNALVRNLTAITGRQIAASPWPLRGFPDAELSVRVEQMLVQAGAGLLLTGQYAVGFESGAGQIKPFSITVPVSATDQNGVAQAHDAAWRQLAERIAKDL
ncbi:PqiC family protein [Pseudoprimorskyibacter insulae]|uniref:ABC-type transport auxiliary lipoprotein component domain-containing protein n=1 Tax=Pseudoprimorskyibacter insulae TaxID=1695997 RepID=A0A2R8B0B3_9RHOB|nr:PqiC family protein [Pseudoprimorskyibacter insulae]SPF81667.1 hypothetical protein PRI8871_03492 [Pseudoprimorskyibacter insulae]